MRCADINLSTEHTVGSVGGRPTCPLWRLCGASLPGPSIEHFAAWAITFWHYAVNHDLKSSWLWRPSLLAGKMLEDALQGTGSQPDWKVMLQATTGCKKNYLVRCQEVVCPYVVFGIHSLQSDSSKISVKKVRRSF